MKIMISQPMRGKAGREIQAERIPIIQELEKQGYEVVDTVFTKEAPKDSDIAMFYLAKSIEAMSKIDGVVFMRGWQQARGCRIEYQVATEYGKFIKLL